MILLDEDLKEFDIDIMSEEFVSIPGDKLKYLHKKRDEKMI